MFSTIKFFLVLCLTLSWYSLTASLVWGTGVTLEVGRFSVSGTFLTSGFAECFLRKLCGSGGGYSGGPIVALLLASLRCFLSVLTRLLNFET